MVRQTAVGGRGRTSARAPWGRLEIDVAAAAEEAAIGALAEDCLGVEVELLSEIVRLRTFWASPRAARAAGKRLLRALGEEGAGTAILRLHVEPVPDERWVERYQAGLCPFPLGRGFLVVPSGAPAGDDGRLPIRLVPGRAFGTGEHATTALCAEALEEHARPGQAWVDLGTGSGILSVVAAGCGVRRVLALDLDPEAVRAARRVVRANGVQARVAVRLGSIELALGTRWDGVVANLESAFLQESAALLAAPLGPGGVLISSGIPEDDADEVARSLAREGLEPAAERVRQGWVLLVHRRPGRGR